jgi:hypothetical protein
MAQTQAQYKKIIADLDEHSGDSEQRIETFLSAEKIDSNIICSLEDIYLHKIDTDLRNTLLNRIEDNLESMHDTGLFHWAKDPFTDQPRAPNIVSRLLLEGERYSGWLQLLVLYDDWLVYPDFENLKSLRRAYEAAPERLLASHRLRERLCRARERKDRFFLVMTLTMYMRSTEQVTDHDIVLFEQLWFDARGFSYELMSALNIANHFVQLVNTAPWSIDPYLHDLARRLRRADPRFIPDPSLASAISSLLTETEEHWRSITTLEGPFSELLEIIRVLDYPK